MPDIIRLDNSTGHDGKAIKVAATYHTIDRLPVARSAIVQLSCSKNGHDNCTIAEGNPNHLIDGVPVRKKHKTSGGAALIATPPQRDE